MKKQLLSIITATAMTLSAMPFMVSAETTEIPQNITTMNEAADEILYWISYIQPDKSELERIINEKVDVYTHSLYETCSDQYEVEKKSTEYYSKLILEMNESVYMSASALILEELGVESDNVFCSKYAPMIICPLTDKQLEIAENSPNIESVSLYKDFEIVPATPDNSGNADIDINSFISTFTISENGSKLLTDNIKADAVFNVGENKTDYLVLYGFSDINEIKSAVKKLNSESGYKWESVITLEEYSGFEYDLITENSPTNNHVKLIVFMDNEPLGILGSTTVSDFSEHIGFDVSKYLNSKITISPVDMDKVKILYNMGDSFDFSGLNLAEGEENEIIITALYGKKYSTDEFSELMGGKYTVSVKGEEYSVYIDDDKSRLIELRNARVISTGESLSGEIVFEGIDEVFRYDADAFSHPGWNGVYAPKDSIVSGVLKASNTSSYLITGDIRVVNTDISEIKGDSNLDKEVNMADAVLIMQSFANPNKYGLFGTDETHITEQGVKNADMDGNGLTNADALAVQKIVLKLNDTPKQFCFYPLNPPTQPISCNDTDGVIDLLNNYELADYYETERDDYKAMFESFKSDGFIYSIKGENGIAMAENRDVCLIPHAQYEDTGILYRVMYKDREYIVFFYTADEYIGETLSMYEYMCGRLPKLSETAKEINGNVINRNTDGTGLQAYIPIDERHYTAIKANITEEELNDFISAFEYERVQINS